MVHIPEGSSCEDYDENFSMFDKKVCGSLYDESSLTKGHRHDSSITCNSCFH
jgi:hypothetical protein